MSPLPRPDIYGYFDSPSQTTPAHDPGETGLCPVCVSPVGKHGPSNRLQTISMCLEAPELRDRSWFFRTHKNCWENATERERGLIESACIDNSKQP